MNGGFDGLSHVLAGIEAALAARLTPIMVNAVIQRAVNDHTSLDLVNRLCGTGIVVLSIEYMDVGNRNQWTPERVAPLRESPDRIARRWSVRPLTRTCHGEVAERCQFEDGGGEISFISSVTQPF
jgi:GTP 3',8-cyclase